MTQFYAQPYDISAAGFYFSDMEEYDAKYTTCKNDFGERPEEFEIQFIDGKNEDAELFKVLGIHQGNIHHFIDAVDEWEEHEKQAVIIAVGECGYDFDLADNDLSISAISPMISPPLCPDCQTAQIRHYRAAFLQSKHKEKRL